VSRRGGPPAAFDRPEPMPLVTALFSLLTRRLGDLVQAVFGWVIVGLFGRLERKRQLGLSVALILAISWPLLVLGVFLPGVAARALAFLPLEQWMGTGPLRAMWMALALLSPIGVGAIVRWVAPDRALHGGVLRTVLGGYPITVGFAVSFLITLVVVPFTKLGALARGWHDEHVFLQVREGAYRRVLDELAGVAASAGLEVQERAVPTSMALATRVIKWFARGSLDAIVADDPRMLRSEELQIYLYPADLLLRGDEARCARFRAAMLRRLPLGAAYQTSEPAAQAIEDEIQRLWDIVAHHHGPDEIGGAARSRLRSITEELDHAAIAYPQWVLLYTNLHRIERAICGGPRLVDPEGALAGESPAALSATAAPKTRRFLLATAVLALLGYRSARSEKRERQTGS
jgi:hypothetical protein